MSLSRRLASRARRLVRPAAAPPSRSQPTGSVAAVPTETTWLGPTMDERIAVARARMRPRGEDPDYDLVRDNFDVAHYLLQSPRVAELPSVDLVEHFLENGVALRKSPHPDFSMDAYLERHPEAEHARQNPYVTWLRSGGDPGEAADPAAGVPELAHALGMAPTELVARVRERRADLLDRLRTGTLGEMFAKATELEPLIGEAWSELARPRMLPFTWRGVTAQTAAAHRTQEAASFRRARLVIVVNRPRWGGGRRMEGHLAHALTGPVAPQDIVVVYTDVGGDGPPGRFPAGVREIDFAEISAGMAAEDAQAVLVAVLRSFRADAVVNINSRMLYHALPVYGAALAASERVFLCFFCNEQSALGVWQGWSFRYLYRTFDTVAGVLTDSRAMADELSAKHRLTAAMRDKVHVFRAPVDAGLPVVESPPAGRGRPQVFWAGRWDRQKRIGLLLEIAGRMPDVDFRMWGEPVTGGPDAASMPANVLVQGRYARLAEIPLSDADAWLYTSAWDGVPSQLLEVAMTGIPLVGTLVGGTGEVLGEGDSWPVPVDAGAEAYETALRSVLADPAGARRRALALRERMLRERTVESYAVTAREVLLLPHRRDER